MKKYLIIFSLALLATMSVAQAQEYTFTSDLTIGANNNDVVNLQSWLIANGYDIPAVSRGTVSKGFFGSQTREALRRYQLSIGLPGTGYFGPLTRARIHGRGNDNSKAINVVSPNGGESWAIGSTQIIRWSTSSNSDNSNVTIKIVRNISGCFNLKPGMACLAVVDPEYTIATNVPNTGSYRWTVTSITGDPNASAVGANYYVRICKNSGNGIGACDTSDTSFSITSGVTDSRSPVINGIDAPTSLSVNQTGTWTVRATDPQNGTLSYTVDWGDTKTFSPMLDCPAGFTCDPNMGMQVAGVQQGSTFTHSYSSSGVYTIRFGVRNSLGLVAQSSVTVQVGGNSTAGPLKIITPNGDEQWKKGTTQTITWSSPAYFRATYADLKLVPYYQPCTGQVCPMGASQTSMMYPYIAPYTIASNISINQNSYSWNVGSVVSYIPPAPAGTYPVPSVPIAPDGQYTIQICETGTNNCDSSDRPFTITTGYNPQVVSPNGGESWLSNSAQQLKWTVSSVTNQNARLDLYLDQADIYCITAPCGSTYVLDKNISVSTVYNWLVATDINNVKIPDGSYRFRVCVAGSTTNCDSSDKPFTISSPISQTIKVTSPNGGEVWTANSVHQISWSVTGATDNNTKVDLYLIRNVTCQTGTTCTPSPYVLDKNVAYNSIYNWIVATDVDNNPIPQGQFKVIVCLAGTNNCDTGDSVFAIQPTVYPTN